MIRRLLRTDGTSEDVPGPLSEKALRTLLATTGVITMAPLRHLGDTPRRALAFDSLGLSKDLPLNVKATELLTIECRQHHKHCGPGVLHKVRGDAVVLPASDLAVD